MAHDGKPDATGRSSGKRTGRIAKLRMPPPKEPWVWLTRQLLTSPAWCAMSVNAHRLMTFLLVEHMNHAGRENGNLKATYNQLVEYGLTRRKITEAILELEALGLVRVEHGGRYNMTNRPSKFRLTFYCDATGNPTTNDWKTTSKEMAAEVHRRLKARPKHRVRAAKNQESMLRSGITEVSQVALRAINGGKVDQ